MKMTKAMLAAAIACGTMVSTAAYAAEEVISAYALDPVVVTATVVPVQTFDAHANVAVITAKEIEDKHYTNVPEALRNITGISIMDYGRPGYDSSNSIRLNGSKNVIILVDGARVSTQNIAGYLASDMVPVENIERIEVMKGNASAIYGADAKGGVINIITKKNVPNKSQISLAGGNFGAEEYKFSTQGTTNKTSYRVNAKKSILGNFEDGNGNKVTRSLNADTIGFMVKQEFSQGTDIALSYDNYNGDFKYHDLFYGNGICEGSNKRNQWTLSSNQKISEKASNTLVLKRTNYDFKYKSVADYSYPANYSNKVNGWSLNDQFKTKIGKAHDFVAGIEYNNDKVDYIYNLNSDKIVNKALFVQDKWQFDDKWDATVGVRLDDHSIAGNAVTPRYNVGYKADENNSMYVSYSRFFVAPEYSQYFGSYGNPKLNPEKGYTWELGYNHKFDESAEASISLFYREANNTIDYSYMTGTYENLNEEKAKGVDVKLQKQFKNISTRLGYTYTNTRATNANSGGYNYNISGYLPKHAVNIGIGYNDKKFDANVDVRGSIDRVGTAYKFPDKNYWLCDLSLNYKPVKNARVFFKVNNLFDKFYAEHSAANAYNPDWYYSMPGRTVLAGVEYNF